MMIVSPPKPHFSESAYVRFVDLVRDRSGLEIPAMRRTELEQAVRGSMAHLHLSSPEELLSRLNDGRDHRAVVEALIAQLTVGETHFFRNRPQFEALKTLLLPQIIERRHGEKRLRLWSAGCSTGEEPYSLAIMLERLLPDIADWDIRILATDVNRDCLEKAAEGVYRNRSFREVPEGIQSAYFTQTGNMFEISPRIRRMVDFSYRNLVVDGYPSLTSSTNAMDLILCRNVLIYFGEATVRRVVELLYASLDVDGWLVVGHAEPSQRVFHQFLVHNAPGTVLYQKSPAPAPPPPSPLPTRLRTRQVMMAPVSSAPLVAVAERPAPAVSIRSMTRLPDPAPAEIRAVQKLIADEQAESAVERLAALSAAQPHDFWVPYLLAKIHADRRELVEAEICVDRALAQAPLLAPAHYLRALILQEAGRWEESRTALRRCTYADPQFWLGYLSMAGLLVLLAQPQEALKVIGTLATLLAGQSAATLVPQGGGLTVGRLSEVVSVERERLMQ